MRSVSLLLESTLVAVWWVAVLGVSVYGYMLGYGLLTAMPVRVSPCAKVGTTANYDFRLRAIS